MDYRKIIKDNINYYMCKNNKRQSDLIKDLNIASSVASSWCSGARTPTLDNLNILANYLNVNIIDFFIDKNKNDVSIIIQIVSQLDPKYCDLIKKQANELLKIQELK